MRSQSVPVLELFTLVVILIGCWIAVVPESEQVVLQFVGNQWLHGQSQSVAALPGGEITDPSNSANTESPDLPAANSTYKSLSPEIGAAVPNQPTEDFLAADATDKDFQEQIESEVVEEELDFDLFDEQPLRGSSEAEYQVAELDQSADFPSEIDNSINSLNPRAQTIEDTRLDFVAPGLGVEDQTAADPSAFQMETKVIVKKEPRAKSTSIGGGKRTEYVLLQNSRNRNKGSESTTEDWPQPVVVKNRFVGSDDFEQGLAEPVSARKIRSNQYFDRDFDGMPLSTKGERQPMSATSMRQDNEFISR